MPEIINQNRVNEKLREFDAQMDGAISAAEKIVKVRLVAENFEDELKWTTNKIAELHDSLKDIHGEWNVLKSKIDKSVTSTNDMKHQADKEVEVVKQRLNVLVDDAAKQLQQANNESLNTHHQYVKESKAATEIVSAAKNACNVESTKLKHLLDSARIEYENIFSSKYKALFEEVGKHSEALVRSNQETIDKLQQSIAAKQDDFHRQIKDDIERQLTDFLSKQNALVQNFGQQVDGFQRSLTAQKVDMEQMSSKVSDMVAKVEATAKWYSDCSNRQDAEIVKLRERDAEVTKRLDRTLELLQNTGMVFSGGKFKGI